MSDMLTAKRDKRTMATKEKRATEKIHKPLVIPTLGQAGLAQLFRGHRLRPTDPPTHAGGDHVGAAAMTDALTSINPPEL